MTWRVGVACAFVVLALAGGLAINASLRTADRRLHAAQLRACERGNVVRDELNDRIAPNLALHRELARLVARAGSKLPPLPTFDRIPLVHCETAVAEP